MVNYMKILLSIVICILITQYSSAVELKEILYTTERSVYSTSLEVLKMWDEDYKIAVNKKYNISERRKARHRLVKLAEYELVNFLKINTAIFSYSIINERFIVKAHQPERPSFLFYMYKSSLQQ